MKFGLYLEEHAIFEWKDFYINFKLLKKLLKSLEYKYKFLTQKQKKGNHSIINKSFDNITLYDRSSIISSLLNKPDLSKEEEKLIIEKFKIQIILELEKVEYFFKQNISLYSNRIKEIYKQLEYIRKNPNLRELKHLYEDAIKEMFKEIINMKSYIELNLKAKTKIIKKFLKYTKYIDRDNIELRDSINTDVENFVNKKIISKSIEHLNSKQTEIEKLFSDAFFDKYSFNAVKQLKDYTNPTFFTQYQSFYFGFLLGIIIILIILCLLIGVHFHIDMDDDGKFKKIFPMFRGFIVFLLYFWFLGLNVYVWTLYHINYQLCFDFDNHYSDVISICKRASFFSFILIFMLLCYMIQRAQIPIIYDLVSFIPLEFTPLICWLSAIIYLCSPFKNFNYLGRVYTFNLFWETMASITVKNELRHTWLGDQLTSLIGPLRDFEYTICYYTHYFETIEEKKRLCHNHRPIVLCLGIFPYFVRLLQCIKTVWDKKKLFPDILNCGKYTLSILVTISSYYSSTVLFFEKTWLIIALTSSCYSYSWDMVMDYGLLEQGPNYPLRNKLIYKKKFIYFTAMTLNFFGRFAWMLTISPEVVYKFIRPEFFLMMIYLIEAFRRGMWNFFRVELKHIDIIKEFKIGPKIELPLKLKNGAYEYQDMKLEIIRKLSKDNNKDDINNSLSINRKSSIDSLAKLGIKIDKKNTLNESSELRAKLTKYLKEYKHKTDKNTNIKKKFIEMKSLK